MGKASSFQNFFGLRRNLATSRRPKSISKCSAAPIERSSKGLLQRLACLTSTRIASERHWRYSAAKSASRQRSTRPGLRTSATKMCSRRFRATATLHDTARRRSFWRSGNLSSAPARSHADLLEEDGAEDIGIGSRVWHAEQFVGERGWGVCGHEF
jgi:hypothetical protein